MTIKIILKTGKEIELTKEEFDELKDNFKEIVLQAFPSYPIQQPCNPVYPQNPIITYGATF